MKSHWVLHKGKRVFISEFSNCGTNADAVRAECAAIKAALANEPDKSALVIANLEGTFVNDGIIQAFRELLPVTNQYVKRRAIIGLSGFRKHFIFLVSKFVGSINFLHFDSLNEALDWVVQD
jgi:hypothetical protein